MTPRTWTHRLRLALSRALAWPPTMVCIAALWLSCTATLVSAQEGIGPASNPASAMPHGLHSPSTSIGITAPPIGGSTNNSFGSGFMVAPGYLLTAHHLLDGKEFIYVGPNAQRKWIRAKLIKSNAQLDLALLKVPVSAPSLTFADWKDVPIGLEVFAIGYPQPAYQGFSKKITQGIINGNRGHQEDLSQQHFFQFSAEVSKGNSGGPIIASDGSVVGMVLRKLNAMTLAERSQDFVINVNYGMKASLILNFLKDSPAAVSTRSLSLQANLRPVQIYRQSEASVFSVIARATPASETVAP